MIHESFHLWRPIGEVLCFVEEEERRRPSVRRLVEGRVQDAILEPSGDRQEGLVESLQAWDLIELDAQDPPRVDALFLDKMLDHLLKQRCLAHLPRTPQNDGGSEARVQLS